MIRRNGLTGNLLPLLALVMVIPRLHAQLGLGLSPMRVELRLEAGSSYSGALDLTNESDVPTRVQAELLDFRLDENATPQFRRHMPEEAEYSCRQWLSVNPMELQLEPKGHAVVRFTVRAPRDAAPGSHHCAIGFMTRPAAAELQSPIGIRPAVRIIAAIYVLTGEAVPLGKLTYLDLERTPGASPTQWWAVVRIRNDGNAYLRPQGTVSVLDSSGQLLETVDLKPMPVLPRREQRLLAPLSCLHSGKRYRLRARMDVGDYELQEAEVEVEAAPAN